MRTRRVVLVLALLAAPVEPSSTRAQGREWTLDEARARWSAMVRPVQHVGVPGYSFQTGVMWDGALVFGPLDFRSLKVMQQEEAPLGDHLLHVTVAFGDPPRCVDRRGTGSPRIRRWLDEGCLPIPHVQTTDGDLVWEQTVFAYLLEKAASVDPQPVRDDVLVTECRFEVTNRGPDRRTAKLWLHFGETGNVAFGYKCRQLDELAPAIPHELGGAMRVGRIGDRVRYVLPAPSDGRVDYVASAPSPTGAGKPAERLVAWAVELPAQGSARFEVRIPYGLVDVDTAHRIAELDGSAELERTRDFWRSVAHGPGSITTPDPWVNDYLAAVACQMAQQVAFRHSTSTWMYKTSPNHYEGYWPCNAAKALPALTLRGLPRLDADVLDGFIRNQTDDVGGLARSGMGHGEELAGEGFAKVPGFLGNFGEWTANPLLLSHGLGLWALASHYRITRDREWLGRGAGSPLQAMLDGCDWLVTQRRRTLHDKTGRPLDQSDAPVAESDPLAKEVAHYGLLPAASAHDWLAGNTIFNDAFCIYGMTEAVRLLGEIGHPRTPELRTELADWRACLERAYHRATLTGPGYPIGADETSFFVPRMVQELDWRKLDWTYTGYGPLRAGAWGALEPHGWLVNHALRFLEVGMPQGEGAYFDAHLRAQQEAARAGGVRPIADVNFADVSDPQAPRHWLWRHYVEYETMWPIGGPLFLARDDLDRFFEWLFHNLAVVVHADWKVGVESLDGVPSCAPGDGERWQTIRKMFVHEFGGQGASDERARWAAHSAVDAVDLTVAGSQSLIFFQAIPRSWLQPGQQLAVRDMGTWLGGKVDLALRVADDGDSVTAEVAWTDLAVSPQRILVRLRSGDGRRVQSATADGVPLVVGIGDMVELPPARGGHVRIVGRFESSMGPRAVELSRADDPRIVARFPPQDGWSVRLVLSRTNGIGRCVLDLVEARRSDGTIAALTLPAGTGELPIVVAFRLAGAGATGEVVFAAFRHGGLEDLQRAVVPAWALPPEASVPMTPQAGEPRPSIATDSLYGWLLCAWSWNGPHTDLLAQHRTAGLNVGATTAGSKEYFALRDLPLEQWPQPVWFLRWRFLADE